MSVTINAQRESGQQDSVRRWGIYRQNSLGQTSQRLGFFTDAALNPSATGAIDVSDFSLSADLSGDDLVAASVSLSTLAFQYDADLSGNGVVCWDDRALMNRQMGKQVSDAELHPRADFVFDGTINADDETQFLVVWASRLQSTPPCPTACVGDFNYDGLVNTADLQRILARLGQSVGPGTLEDLNGDGQVNTADLTTFLTEFGTVCM